MGKQCLNGKSALAKKLKYHAAKAGGVRVWWGSMVAFKLKYHGLKARGVLQEICVITPQQHVQTRHPFQDAARELRNLQRADHESQA
jgi:hypothetical protein